MSDRCNSAIVLCQDERNRRPGWTPSCWFRILSVTTHIDVWDKPIDVESAIRQNGGASGAWRSDCHRRGSHNHYVRRRCCCINLHFHWFTFIWTVHESYVRKKNHKIGDKTVFKQYESEKLDSIFISATPEKVTPQDKPNACWENQTRNAGYRRRHITCVVDNCQARHTS